MGWDAIKLWVAQWENMCLLDRSFLSQIVQLVTVFLFSVSHKNKQKALQTLQTAQLSQIILPEVLMF